MHRYVSLRKKMLGVDELHMYDLYTPMIKDVEMPVNYDKAKELIIKGLAPLGEEYVSILKSLLISFLSNTFFPLLTSSFPIIYPLSFLLPYLFNILFQNKIYLFFYLNEKIEGINLYLLFYK